MNEAGINPKVMQKTFGHSNIPITFNIYMDVVSGYITEEFIYTFVAVQNKSNNILKIQII